ncbi:hypothetical protein MKW98_010922 [Papaver atlanticum]|uniref:Uncharacterized protein n=1 Tax=Papaver atlanticum TaxID=357466 RepID=A0AAD4SL99_9MAGN|nr:hypothetical protein MKW98_010922 [Papaver atlanticum]
MKAKIVSFIKDKKLWDMGNGEKIVAAGTYNTACKLKLKSYKFSIKSVILFTIANKRNFLAHHCIKLAKAHPPRELALQTYVVLSKLGGRVYVLGYIFWCLLSRFWCGTLITGFKVKISILI